MTGNLLHTKLYLPLPRPSLVPRPPLCAKLDAGLNGRLTLVSAPAGFGKSTLVAEWIRARRESGDVPASANTTFCWVSLDETDNDAVQFWSYVLSAMAGEEVTAAQQLLVSLSEQPMPALTAVIAQLLNSVAAYEGKIVLVLDDYHVINDSAIHDQVNLLLDRLPPQLHLMLLTRADPPFPLPRWRARREMVEIRQADLRFSQPDTNRLLNDLLALDLSAEDVAALDRRTEGWVAGLQMAALALQQPQVDRRTFIQSFAGSHHYIMAYLVEEVLKHQPAEVQQFLQQTAVLRRLCAPLCTAVTGNAQSNALLTELYRQNLFLIPLDDAHFWYRTHHLFADLLATRLAQHSSGSDIQALHRRAAGWYEANDYLEEAIYHALRSGDMPWAAQLVEGHARPVMQQGRLNTLLRWIDSLPPDVLALRPRLRLDQAWSLFLSGNAMLTKEILLDTRRSLDDDPDLVKDDAIRGELATMLANCASLEEDVESVMAEVEKALAHLPADDYVFRARALNAAGAAHGLAGDTEALVKASQEVQELAVQADNRFLAAHALSMIAEARLHQGRLRESEAACRRIVELATGPETAESPFAGMGYIGLAAIRVERCELQEASQDLVRGLAISGQGGIGYKYLDAYCTMIRLHQAAGDVSGAAAALEQAEAFAPLPWHQVQLAAYAVRFWLGEGDLAMARHWLERPLPVQMPVVVREVLDATRARMALADGNWLQVLALHEVVVASAARPSASRQTRIVELSLLKALAAEGLGERQTALASLHSAVELAAPEGAMLSFLELGPDLAVLLRALREEGLAVQPFTDQLLARFPARIGAQTGLVEPLSERELEVLRLIARGKSNKEIAGALMVTLNTVKKHSSHIYEKLGVHGRTQAIARARELGFLQ